MSKRKLDEIDPISDYNHEIDAEIDHSDSMSVCSMEDSESELEIIHSTKKASLPHTRSDERAMEDLADLEIRCIISSMSELSFPRQGGATADERERSLTSGRVSSLSRILEGREDRNSSHPLDHNRPYTQSVFSPIASHKNRITSPNAINVHTVTPSSVVSNVTPIVLDAQNKRPLLVRGSSY